MYVTFEFFKVLEEIEPSKENLSQSSSSQSTADEKSKGIFQRFLKPFKFSKDSDEIKPSDENSSQSDSGQMTADDKMIAKVSNF